MAADDGTLEVVDVDDVIFGLRVVHDSRDGSGGALPPDGYLVGLLVKENLVVDICRVGGISGTVLVVRSDCGCPGVLGRAGLYDCLIPVAGEGVEAGRVVGEILAIDSFSLAL